MKEHNLLITNRLSARKTETLECHCRHHPSFGSCNQYLYCTWLISAQISTYKMSPSTTAKTLATKRVKRRTPWMWVSSASPTVITGYIWICSPWEHVRSIYDNPTLVLHHQHLTRHDTSAGNVFYGQVIPWQMKAGQTFQWASLKAQKCLIVWSPRHSLLLHIELFYLKTQIANVTFSVPSLGFAISKVSQNVMMGKDIFYGHPVDAYLFQCW